METPPLDPGAAEVGRHYDAIVDYESQRLVVDGPVEFAITCRALARWLPERSRVAEIGVGGGHYTLYLARRGAQLHLVDVSQVLLAGVQAQLAREELSGQVLGATLASATDLSALAGGTFDAVLLLGPLYHLRTAAERRQAVAEAARLLKPEGVLLAAGINRLAYLRDCLRFWGTEVFERQAFHEQYLADGNLDPAHAPPIGHAHLTTVAEFRAEFAGLSELALWGVESFANNFQASLVALSPDQQAAWLDLLERTAGTDEGRAIADHFLYVGRKE